MLNWIKAIVRDIDDEIMGAEHYAKTAHKAKAMDANSAQTYLAMAKQELAHVETLSDLARRIVKNSQERKDPDLAGIEAIWELQTERISTWVPKVKMMLDGL